MFSLDLEFVFTWIQSKHAAELQAMKSELEKTKVRSSFGELKDTDHLIFVGSPRK